MSSQPASLRGVSAPSPVAVMIEGLSMAPFAPLFALEDKALLERGIRRVIASKNPGTNYPCRVSLDFATEGEELLLLNYRHLDMPTTPYRAEGPIYVRKNAAAFGRQEVSPAIIMSREMAVRAYDHAGMMMRAELAGKEALTTLTAAWLARPEVVHVDYHSARRGCFFCRAWRA